MDNLEKSARRKMLLEVVEMAKEAMLNDMKGKVKPPSPEPKEVAVVIAEDKPEVGEEEEDKTGEMCKHCDKPKDDCLCGMPKHLRKLFE